MAKSDEEGGDSHPIVQGARAAAADLASTAPASALVTLVDAHSGAAAFLVSGTQALAKAGLATAAAARAATDRRAQAMDSALLLELGVSTPMEAQELREDSALCEAVLLGFRAAMDACDPAVIPVLARLVRWYRGAPTDAFFRACSRTLVDVAARDLETWRCLSGFARSALTGRVGHVRVATCIFNGDRSCHVYPFTDRRAPTEPVVHDLPADEDFAIWERLFYLMEREGLGARDDRAMRVMNIGQLSRLGNDSGVVLTAATVERLANALGTNDR